MITFNLNNEMKKIFFCPYKIWFEPICFQVLWQFGMLNSDSREFSVFPTRATLRVAKTKFHSSYL